MALVVESTSSASAGNSSSVIVTKPTGVVVGDLLLILSGHQSLSTMTCTGFTSALLADYNGPGGISDVSVTVLYKIADSGDVSAANYTVNGASGVTGIVSMFRISGWTTGNPIFSSNFIGFNPTSSGTFSATGLNLLRLNQQLLILFSFNADSTDGDYMSYPAAAPTVTSSDSNPSWTIAANIAPISINSSFGRMGMYTAYASTTSVSAITGYSLTANENGSDNKIGMVVGLLVLNEPRNISADIPHLAITPVIEGVTASQVNVVADVSHSAITPSINGVTGRAVNPQWTNNTKSSTTWTNETR